MRIPSGAAVLTLLMSAILGGGVSLFVHHTARNADQNLQIAGALLLVFTFIIVFGVLIHFHHSLQHAKRNLDEAQRLAALGSWERDIATGSGYWSDNRYRLFGMEPRRRAPELEEFYRLIHPDDREQVRATVSAAVKNCSSYEVSYRLVDDTHHRVFLSRGLVVRDASGSPASVVGTTQDITEKLRQQRLTDDLLKQKDIFISRLGHDLNTPLTPLVALLPMVRERAVDDKQRELIDICIGNVTHIRDIVAKTMQLARRFSPFQDRLVLDDVRLLAAVTHYLSTLDEMLGNHGMSVDNRIPATVIVRADRTELEDVFHNVISNAVKFSPYGSQITLEATTADGQVTVSISDNGIGLSEEECRQVFDEFYKADSSRHELGASGLGLSICRHIIENHGGRIWAESRGKGEGTSINFTLAAGGNA